MSDKGNQDQPNVVGLRELSRDTPGVMAAVEEGETVVVTRHRKPIATLEPMTELKARALAVSKSPEFVARRKQSDRDIAAGRLLSDAELENRLVRAADESDEGRKALAERQVAIDIEKAGLTEDLERLFAAAPHHLAAQGMRPLRVWLATVRTLVGGAIEMADENARRIEAGLPNASSSRRKSSSGRAASPTRRAKKTVARKKSATPRRTAPRAAKAES